MPRTAQDLESFLHRLGRPFEAVGRGGAASGTYALSTGASSPPIVIRVAPPVVLLRADIGPLPSETVGAPGKGHGAQVFRRLLELNAVDLLHASYGIADGTIVITASLMLDNLDLNELEAALSDIDLALATHVTQIRQLY